jgi:hypothetical protein
MSKGKNVRNKLSKLTNSPKAEAFKKSRFSRTNLSIFAVIFAAIGGYLIYSSFAATYNLTVNGNTKFQTMDGFGVSINSDSWKNGELKPAIDMLVDQNGSQVYRVVMEMTDWESTNDDANANNYNWNYYDPIYSGATTFDTGQSGSNFANLWNTIDYLHQKGIPDNQIILSFMGIGPSWMGGDTVTSATEDEWAEMVTSAAYYGYSHGHTFKYFSPDNEEDWQFNEGIKMTATGYASAMNKVAMRLDALGLNNIRMVAAESVGTGSSYITPLTNYPNLMSKIDFFDAHNYSGDASNFAALAKNNGGKDAWMSEFSVFEHGLSFIQQGINGIMMWDAYDSVYNHAILNGLGSQPGNDAGNAPAMIAYNASTGVYTPRKSFYNFAQLYKYVPIGSVRIDAAKTGGSGTIMAFYNQATGRVTIVGQNTGSTADTVTTSLTNLPSISSLEFYQTTSTQNMQRGADIPLTNNTFTYTAAANSVYTLTTSTVTDTTAPTVSVTAPTTGATVTGSAVTLSANASDNVGVLGVQFKVDGSNVGSEDTTSPYAVTWNSNSVANGSHTITAVARDAAGNTTTSTAFTVTVSNTPDTTAPTVSITAPLDAANVSGSSVAISANAADTGGSGLVGVQFKVDGSNIGSEDASSPYSVNWDSNTVADGTHTLTAVARDGAGNTTTSASVNVSVKNAAPSGSLLLGNQTIQSSADNNSSGSAEGFSYTAVATGIAGSLSFYVDTGNAATALKVGVYSNNAGHPGTLLTSGTVTNPTAGSWNTVALSPAATITSGTVYWIRFL